MAEWIGEEEVCLSPPLLRAVKNKNIDEVKTLLNAGANTFDLDSSGETSFHVAASYGYDDCLKVLCAHVLYGEVNIMRDRNYTTPLDQAVVNDNYEGVNILLDHGASSWTMHDNYLPYWFKNLIEKRRKCAAATRTLYGLLKRFKVAPDMIRVITQMVWKTRPKVGGTHVKNVTRLNNNVW